MEFINGKSSIWSPGAVHIIGDTLRIGGYTFKTDEADPLVFKVSASKGYVYVKGTGSVTDPSGKSTVLPTPVATPQTPFADWTQRQKDEGMIKAVRDSAEKIVPIERGGPGKLEYLASPEKRTSLVRLVQALAKAGAKPDALRLKGYSAPGVVEHSGIAFTSTGFPGEIVGADDGGVTALVVALTDHNAEMVAALLEAGADPLAKISEGKSAVEVADSIGGEAMKKLLAGKVQGTLPAYRDFTVPAKQLILDLGNKVTMKLVLIPAGKFMMGSPETEKDRGQDEVQHEVTINKAFYMGITHVTVDQFAAFVKDSGYKTEAEKDGYSVGAEILDGKIGFGRVDGCSWRNPSFDQKGDHPVVQVSWNDTKAFCDWLSMKSGKTVQLPTEAQWEYACRAGAKTVYPWGDDPGNGKAWANCADQILKKKLPNLPVEFKFFSWDDGFAFTSPVGSFKGNAFGLYDMIGNAWEWCQDRYGDYDKEAASDPTGEETGARRVLRGGCWFNGPQVCRSAFRLPTAPNWRTDAIGFRVSVVAGAAERATQPAVKSSSQPAERLTLDLGNKVTMKLVLIPAGKFMMGSTADEQEKAAANVMEATGDKADFSNEGPQREVTISKAFYMGVYLVTQEQYEQIMGENPSHFKGEQNPVECVSWDDAVEFCKKLSRKTGKTVTLPTEAHWEYACRAGSKTRFCFGDADDKLGDYAWYTMNSDHKTHPVGQKKPNAWGLYDMHGNVHEWCWDWYADDYANANKTDPTGPASGAFRVLRGGTWGHYSPICRSARRGGLSPDSRDQFTGFRVSMDLK